MWYFPALEWLRTYYGLNYPFPTDIDECTTGQNNCHVNALCSNTVGLYVCRCVRGYVGDGKICTGMSFMIKERLI